MEKQELELQTSFLFKASVKELIALGLDVNHLYILDCLLVKKAIPEHTKTATWLQTLLRKGYITTDYAVTPSGLNVWVDMMEGKENIKEEQRATLKGKSEKFDEWWLTFPNTDGFIHKGKTFRRTRSFKTNQNECRFKFTQIIAEGKYTAEQLIKALKDEVEAKKDDSYRANSNKLTYMHNSLTYLNKRDFEGFIEADRETVREEETTGQTFSI